MHISETIQTASARPETPAGATRRATAVALLVVAALALGGCFYEGGHGGWGGRAGGGWAERSGRCR